MRKWWNVEKENDVEIEEKKEVGMENQINVENVGSEKTITVVAGDIEEETLKTSQNNRGSKWMILCMWVCKNTVLQNCLLIRKSLAVCHMEFKNWGILSSNPIW